MDARRFFEVAIPELALRRPEVFARQRGRLAFIVRDVGAWTVRLGDDARPTVAGADPSAELVVSISAARFDELVEGRLDVPAAVSAHEIAADGDLALLDRLANLMSGPRGPVGVRARR